MIATTSSGSSVIWSRSRSLSDTAPDVRSVPRIQSSRPDQYAEPTSTTGKWRTLPVWMSVMASNSSSSVPKPPGRMTKPSAYFTNIVLRAKK